MPEIPEIINLNPELKTYKKTDGVLIIEKTHKDPVIHTESYGIAELQAKIDKIDGVIEKWVTKKAPLQVIIDKYNSLEAV